VLTLFLDLRAYLTEPELCQTDSGAAAPPHSSSIMELGSLLPSGTEMCFFCRSECYTVRGQGVGFLVPRMLHRDGAWCWSFFFAIIKQASHAFDQTNIPSNTN
jgi:hypothetical protein